LSTDTREREVEILGLREGMEASLEPKEVRVVLFGPLPVLDTLVADDVRVTVDVFDLITGTHRIRPAVDIPERGIEMRSIRPESIQVIITQTLTQTITNTDTLSATLPLPETNKSLLLFIASMNQETDAPAGSSPITAVLPAVQAISFLFPDLAQFAILPARRFFI